MELCRVPDMEEVHRVVFSINPYNTPGPDRFCSRFYQACWEIICNDLMVVVTDFFTGSVMLQCFQCTLLILLPKKTSPSTWVDFRPISLCNINSKIFTKLLVMRLSPILPRIISPS